MPAPARAIPQPLQSLLQTVPSLVLSALPLALLQPILSRIAHHVAHNRPELFARLGPHVGKRFLIDPIDLPLVMVLRPDAARPYLKAYRRSEMPQHDAAVAGRFLDLMAMIDGSADGDALFFSRDLRVTGDTEAVVALRNALDDVEGSALDSVIASLGPLSHPAAFAVSAFRNLRNGSRQ